MLPQRDKLIQEIVSTVSLVQEISGEETAQINETTIPIKMLIGFDSMRIVETTTFLSEKLGVEIKSKKGRCFNPFISADGSRALSLTETADRLIAMLA